MEETFLGMYICKLLQMFKDHFFPQKKKIVSFKSKFFVKYLIETLGLCTEKDKRDDFYQEMLLTIITHQLPHL